MEPQRAIVLGRAPDAAVAAAVIGEDRDVEARSLTDPYVSGTHAAVWLDATHANVHDLGSRNGTWLLLPKNQTVQVDVPEVVLLLGQTFGGAPASDHPAAPMWRSSQDYAGAVAESIQRWIEAHGIEAR